MIDVPIFCELRGVSAADALESEWWKDARRHMRKRFDEMYPGRRVKETLTEDHRKLGNGRTEIVSVIKWMPADG